MKEIKKKQDDEAEFRRFEKLTKNLISVSNVEVREKIKEEKRKKKPSKRKVR